MRIEFASRSCSTTLARNCLKNWQHHKDDFKEASDMQRNRVNYTRIPFSMVAGGVDLYLDQQHLHPTTATGRLHFQITGAFAEFARSMVRRRTNAGSARAQAQEKRLGRRPVSNNVFQRIRAELATGAGILKTARALGVGTATVHRVKRQVTGTPV